ncbi:hypothetical protein Patl1_15283 [Pistacia atlantica]|uniref:Uncharacterized protein n=1 Tax=Pistacia atlantica TaxID=434234 RepID=A0ACC1B7X8_9ROSI|nr:hypothetical protein Patl1_15283 [Pistacia atlantica]
MALHPSPSISSFSEFESVLNQITTFHQAEDFPVSLLTTRTSEDSM